MDTATKEYYAFISYKREDEKWAKWLAGKLENYHLPSTLNGKELPKNLRPVFKDTDELSAGNLPKQIYHALSISKNLIVVCSPQSAQSEWVNKEIEDFVAIKGGKADNVYPFIIEGTPFSKDAAKECFPKALKDLPDNEERLGGNINEQGGRDAAVVKVISGMLGVSFDSLWQKHERALRQKKRVVIAATIAAFLCISGIASWMYWQNLQTRQANWKMMENRARFVAEKGEQLIQEGDSYLARLLALEILPTDLENPDKPYTVEAEGMLRKAIMRNCTVLRGHSDYVNDASFSPDGKKIVSVSGDKTIRIWDIETGKQIGKIRQSFLYKLSFL
ncbi:MAG: TIR domain-containing protein [Bacteroidaceae bacterium]|nr:TIR domain-containing protein [Bacteroidaceae bacterium]